MAGTSGSIVQVSTSPGGVPKLAVLEAVVTSLGLVGDGHNDRRNHGGPERAICVYSMEVIQALQAEGHPIVPGGVGENVTVCGLDWSLVVPGVQLRLGSDVLAEVTRYTTPCVTNARWFTGADFMRMSEDRYPGFSRVYARVIEPGTIRPGDPVALLAAQH